MREDGYQTANAGIDSLSMFIRATEINLVHFSGIGRKEWVLIPLVVGDATVDERCNAVLYFASQQRAEQFLAVLFSGKKLGRVKPDPDEKDKKRLVSVWINMQVEPATGDHKSMIRRMVEARGAKIISIIIPKKPVVQSP